MIPHVKLKDVGWKAKEGDKCIRKNNTLALGGKNKNRQHV